jgi:integrase
LPSSAIDLQSGWINYPRPKTAIMRHCPLWPETVAALREAIASRPTPKNEADADLVFVTKYGKSWATDAPGTPVGKEFRKLLDETKIFRKGIGFYALRHTFETIAGATTKSPSTPSWATPTKPWPPIVNVSTTTGSCA